MLIHDLGIVEYEKALAIQRRAVEKLQRSEGEERLYLLEHRHVITLGRNASQSSLIAGSRLLRDRGVTIVDTDRGGDITYHGPGQLVGYPIIRLEEGRRDIRRYVADVEEALLRTLARFDIDGRRDPVHRGVWVDDRKIASVGIRISRWVTSHGFALNVNTDLSYFSLIHPCGLTGCVMTSIAKEAGRAIDMPVVKEIFSDEFAAVFGRVAVAEPTREGAHG